ncbi:hypothetical protein [Allomuricauda sp. SCSIO 65647]|uniref:hypothetical protein n=1 Tax=Allomuricauda sp. SCSIO 65647 TaxID=2908843 RepID=UPI001F334243|nr:hypothetical protein [Muricauda sp. SCSIO 65647]UJH67365.1 hypothetical protein L0P89_15620 [Muricauda sp. SCSIO 65647]
MKQKTKYVDLSNVLSISRGDDERILKYLDQFNQLIPERMIELQRAIDNQNRLKIRQIVHQMGPQIQFFGISSIVPLVQQLELEYETIPIKDLNDHVVQIMAILEKALAEVSQLITTYTK